MDSKINIRKDIYLCILHCISHKYISLCSRASFIWTTRLKHLFCWFSWTSIWDHVVIPWVLRTRPRWSLTDPREDRVAPRRSSGGFVWQTWKRSKQTARCFPICVVWWKQNRTGNNQNDHYLLIMSKPVLWLALKFEGWEELQKVKEIGRDSSVGKLGKKNALALRLVRIVMSKWANDHNSLSKMTISWATGFPNPI